MKFDKIDISLPMTFGKVGVERLCGRVLPDGPCCRVANHEGECIDPEAMAVEITRQRWCYLPPLSDD